MVSFEMIRVSPRSVLCLALVAFNVSASARGVRVWSDAELMKMSELAVIARPVSSTALNETNLLGYSPFSSFHGFRGVDTTFKVLDVLKGAPRNDRIVVHHYLEDLRPDDCPGFIQFPDGNTNHYTLYLVKDGPDRYAPATGQIDPEQSVKLLEDKRQFPGLFPLLPPAADADPAIRHAVQVHVPVRLLAERTEDAIVIKTDEIMATNLTVGSNVFTGTSMDVDIYCRGKRLDFGPDSLQSEFADGSCDETLHRDVWGIPKPGEKYTIIIKLTLFETDEPPQHMWSPQSGNYYKVLCERDFKLMVP